METVSLKELLFLALADIYFTEITNTVELGKD